MSNSNLNIPLPQREIKKPEIQQNTPNLSSSSRLDHRQISVNKNLKQGPIRTRAMQIQEPSLILPEIKPIPQGFSLGKLDILLKDSRIQTIECQGPEKSILIKRDFRINSTSIKLSQEEINQIIGVFSEETRIPIIGGMLKAAVGNLFISSISSESIGSRFTINIIPLSANVFHQQNSIIRKNRGDFSPLNSPFNNYPK
jgi:hypothetical protein